LSYAQHLEQGQTQELSCVGASSDPHFPLLYASGLGFKGKTHKNNNEYKLREVREKGGNQVTRPLVRIL